ncbi:MAG: acylphosphatase [Euryarchaeota archaeon]|nr:acylphosphatase [Euryarchaeota archaeon]MCG2738401.1 acylphosphatase [Candidatus Methanoperedenaceae archaeon]
MQTRIKRYTVTIRGKVQHIGYRGIIEGTARKLDIKGYVFNDIDNSVKIVCEGLQKSVDTFLDSLKEFARTDIERIEKKEINDEIPLPHMFSRVATDEYYEFSRKFDIGLDFLDGIKTDTGEMKGTLVEVNGSLNKINNTLESFVGDQRDLKIEMLEHNQWMKGHNQRLEKIIEKLAEK